MHQTLQIEREHKQRDETQARMYREWLVAQKEKEEADAARREREEKDSLNKLQGKMLTILQSLKKGTNPP